MLEGLVSQRGVVPFPGRREIFLLAAGYTPALWPYDVRGMAEEELAVRVYVDVSGSTSPLWTFLYGLVLHLHQYVARPVLTFSNAVTSLSMKDLRQGRVQSTLGTDFDCVIEHALDHKHRRILIVTDGEAELAGLFPILVRQRGLEVYLVLTYDNPSCPLNSLARARWVIPGEALLSEPAGGGIGRPMRRLGR